MKKLTMLILNSLLSLSAVASAQSSNSVKSKNGDWTLRVEVWEAKNSLSEQTDQPALSSRFAASALKAAAQIRDWQWHLAYTLQNGYPLSDSWIASDRDHAADAIRLAELAIANDTDREALVQVLNLFISVQRWSDARLEDKKNLHLAEYYISRSALDNDELFQKNIGCTNSLMAMMALRRLEEDCSCC